MKQDNKPKKIVALRLPMELYEEISALAQENTRSVPNQIRQIVREYLRSLGKKV